MSIQHQFKQFQLWRDYGGRLFWLRLKMLRLDAVAQIRSIVFLFVATLVATVAFFLGFISLLFGLNSILAPDAKIMVFFGLAAFFAVLMAGLLIWVSKLWQLQGSFMNDTMAAMSEDFAYLQGEADTTLASGRVFGKADDETH